jgi:hypothetical protein
MPKSCRIDIDNAPTISRIITYFPTNKNRFTPVLENGNGFS